MSVIDHTSRIQTLVIGALPLSAWQALVTSSPVASWFQAPEAYTFYQSLDNIHATSRFKSFGWAVLEDGRLTGLLIGYTQCDGRGLKRWASRRAIIQGGPLLASDISIEALRLLLKTTINALVNSVVYIEARNFSDYARWQDAFLGVGFHYQSHYDFQLSPAATQYTKELQRNLREAVQEGVRVVEKPTDQQFEEFYNLLAQRYHTKIHKPLPPKDYFDLLRQQPDVLTCVVLSPQNSKRGVDTVVGGFIGPCLLDGCRSVLYDMYSCGSMDVPRRWHPSEVVTDYVIRRAAEQGVQCFDFMGAGVPEDGGYGVRDFKAKFGGELLTPGRYLYRCSPLLYRLGCFAIRHHLV